jgi:hypothetical protein
MTLLADKLSPTGMFANDSDQFKHCDQVMFHHRYAIEGHIAEIDDAWRMEMPLVSVKTRRDIFRVTLLPCGYTDRPHHLLAIPLRSWTAGNRFERGSPGHDVFTFLVDLNFICRAQTEQLWVDNRWWVAHYQNPTRNQDYVSRNIQIRVKANPEKWSFTSATAEDATWSAKDMVLQLPSRTAHVMELDQVLISFKYVTGSQINFALELLTLLDSQTTDKDDEPRDRILVSLDTTESKTGKRG